MNRPRRIRYTVHFGPDPTAGAVLRGKRAVWLVLEARRIDTADGARRFSLAIVRVPEAPADAPSFSLVWDRKRKRRP